MTPERERHGCLTAWIILMIVANAGSALMNLLGSAALGEVLVDVPG